MKTKIYLLMSSTFAIAGAVVLLCAALASAGCATTVTREETTNTQRVVSEEPVLGHPVPPGAPAPKP